MVAREHGLSLGSGMYFHIVESKFEILIPIQGTFGPMASAFNVCCLAQTWRMVPDAQDGYLNIADPKWYAWLNSDALKIHPMTISPG